MDDISTRIAALARAWDEAVLAHLIDDEKRVGSVLQAAATEADLVSLEQRIDRELPPSYRAFLAHSNGAWSKPGQNTLLIPNQEVPAAGLLAADQVGWLADLDPGFVEVWLESATVEDEDRLPDTVYFDYSRSQCPAEARLEHLSGLLMVSCFDDGSAVFLNPAAVAADGEWEAWDFGIHSPGAYRYRSFADLLQAQPEALAREDQRYAAAVSRALAEDTLAIEAALTAIESGDWTSRDVVVLYQIIEPEPWLNRLASLLSTPGVDYAALAAIARVETPAALEIVLAMVERDQSAQIVAAAMPRLVSDADPRATEAALGLLESQPHAGRSVPWTATGTELIWRAWEHAQRPSCLAAAADRLDRRAVEPLCCLLTDPNLAAADRAELAFVASRFPDEPLVEAILAAARLGGPHLPSVVNYLIARGEFDAAESLITPEALANELTHSALGQAQREIARRRAGHSRIRSPLQELQA